MVFVFVKFPSNSPVYDLRKLLKLKQQNAFLESKENAVAAPPCAILDTG